MADWSGLLISSVFAQDAATPVVEKAVTQQSAWELLWNANPLVQLVALVLAVSSIVSWAIIFWKWNQLKKAQAESESYWDFFARTQNWADLVKAPVREGPLYEVMRAVQETMASRPNEANKTFLHRYIETQIEQQKEEKNYEFEQYMSFLATTASVAPYVGLFGTVLGILMAFYEIGQSGSSSLATVGPSISEALIVTAMGLAAAIPATVAYNVFVKKIRVLGRMMELFAEELMVRLSRGA